MAITRPVHHFICAKILMNAVGSVDRKLDSWGREHRLHGIKMQINKDCAFQVHLLATRANKESGLSVRVERSRESLQAEKTKKAYRQRKNNPRWWGGSLSKGKTQQSAGRRHFRPNISMQTTAITPSASRRRLFMIVKDPWHNWMILSWYSDLAELIPFSFFFLNTYRSNFVHGPRALIVARAKTGTFTAKQCQKTEEIWCHIVFNKNGIVLKLLQVKRKPRRKNSRDICDRFTAVFPTLTPAGTETCYEWERSPPRVHHKITIHNSSLCFFFM